MTQSFNRPQVYLVLVTTKQRGILRRVDSIHEEFSTAAKRIEGMHLEADERAKIEARGLWGK